MNKFIYKNEFGSSLPVRFLGADKVTAYDSRGNEVKVPICSKCGNHKSELLGKESNLWICLEGCENE